MEEPPPKPKNKKKKKKKSKKRKGKGKGKRRNEDYPFEEFSDYSNDSEYEWVSDSNSEFSAGYSNAYDEYEHHYNVFEDLENGHKKYKKADSPYEIIRDAEEHPMIPGDPSPVPPPRPILMANPQGGPPMVMMAPPGGGPLVPYKMIDPQPGPPPPPILVTPPGGGPPQAMMVPKGGGPLVPYSYPRPGFLQ